MTKKKTPAVPDIKQEVTGATDAQVKIWERRLVNPLMQDTQGVSIKEQQRWELRWIDSGRQGRFYTASREQGWMPVHPDELEDSMENLGLTDHKDGQIRRGIKGQEILMKMPKSIAERIRKRKAAIVTSGLKKTKQNLASAAAQRFGTEEAADFVMGKSDIDKTGVGGLRGELIDSVPELP
jgi:hypothetical protein